MSMLSIRISRELNALLSEESRIAEEPKSSMVRTALEEYLKRRREERFIADLSRAAALSDTEAPVIAAEALPLDNEALALAEGRDPSAHRPEDVWWVLPTA